MQNKICLKKAFPLIHVHTANYNRSLWLAPSGPCHPGRWHHLLFVGWILGGTTTTRIGVTWLYVRNTPYYSEPISASFTNSLICSMSPLPSSPAAVIGQHAHSVAIGCTLCVDKFTPSRSSKHCRDFCTSAPPTVWRHTVTEVKFESKQAVSHT